MKQEIEILCDYWEENREIAPDMREDDRRITKILEEGGDNDYICGEVNGYVSRKIHDSFIEGFYIAAGLFIDILQNIKE